jgi:hypothetical protein
VFLATEGDTILAILEGITRIPVFELILGMKNVDKAHLIGRFFSRHRVLLKH